MTKTVCGIHVSKFTVHSQGRVYVAVHESGVGAQGLTKKRAILSAAKAESRTLRTDIDADDIELPEEEN